MPRATAAARTQTPPPAAPAIAGGTERKAARTVTVACKIPNGLILQLQQPMKQVEQGRSGASEVTINVKHGERIIVAGPAYPNGQVPKGFKRRPDDADGMALTHKVPADFWEQWIQQNKDADYVKSRMIFAFADVEDVRSRAAEFVKVQSGFQALDPEGDSRVPKPVGNGVSPIEKAKPGEE